MMTNHLWKGWPNDLEISVQFNNLIFFKFSPKSTKIQQILSRKQIFNLIFSKKLQILSREFFIRKLTLRHHLSSSN